MSRRFRRRGTPLQQWRAKYNMVSQSITALKKPDANWGKFKKSREQSRLEFMRGMARELMATRPDAVALTHEAWEQDNAGHNRRAMMENAEQIVSLL